MNIYEVTENKKRYLDLLLLGDEEESMIDGSLSGGAMYVLDDNGVKAQCVVADQGDGVLELKNIAVVPEYQRRGYARALIDFIADRYKGEYRALTAGTGDVPWVLRFYEKCGFVSAGVIKNFFTDNYDHPIFDGGLQLVDMIYLVRRL